MSRAISIMILVAFMLAIVVSGVQAAPNQPVVPQPIEGKRTPTPTAVPVRHAQYELWAFEGNQDRIGHRFSDEMAIGLSCSAMWGELNPSQPGGIETIGRMAQVVKVRGVWYMVIEDRLGEYADILYCRGGVNDYAPAWIEDRDPGFPGDRLTLTTTAVRTQALEPNQDVVWVACGQVEVGLTWLCVRLDVMTGAQIPVGHAPYHMQTVDAVNVPAWTSTLMAYPKIGCYE